jgi:pyruvate dehydrogenase E1 component
MFGFQRIGDLMWLAGDIKAKGFLLGATSGRTTLNGEGLQHQDGHSLLLSSSIPSLATYDPAFTYEVAVIIADGMRRMYVDGEDLFYYLTLYNENYPMPPMPENSAEGILKGLYKFKHGPDKLPLKAHLLGSGPILREAIHAQQILADKYGVSADVWSATSYKLLRNDALRARRWNMLHPSEPPRQSYLESLLQSEQGSFVAVSDNMKLVPDQIAPWIPGGLTTLGTDGFGRSDTRERLRRFFEVDAASIVVATLYSLAERKKVEMTVVSRAIKDLGVDPQKVHPQLV